MSSPILRQGLVGQVAKGLQRRGGPGMGLKMTAMIDVIFLLLTFFVLTAKFPAPESHLPVVMPKPATQAAALQQKGPMTVQLKAIESGCQVIIDQSNPVVLSEQHLDAGLSAVSNEVFNAAKMHDVVTQGVEIHCDNQVQWDYVVKVYDTLYRIGATKITFVTQEEKADAP